MANSLRQILQTYSETCNFYVIQYIGIQKQSVGNVLKVLLKSLKTFFVEIHFIVNLLCKNLIRNYENNLEQFGAWLVIYVTRNFFI